MPIIESWIAPYLKPTFADSGTGFNETLVIVAGQLALMVMKESSEARDGRKDAKTPDAKTVEAEWMYASTHAGASALNENA